MTLLSRSWPPIHLRHTSFTCPIHLRYTSFTCPIHLCCQGRLHEMKRKRQEQEGYSREVANDYLEELSRRKRAEEAAQAQ